MAIGPTRSLSGAGGPPLRPKLLQPKISLRSGLQNGIRFAGMATLAGGAFGLAAAGLQPVATV